MSDSKKGFVLMETIVVISVLCVTLILLYGAYSKIIMDTEKKSAYDNTEYIYKTSVIRDFLEKHLDMTQVENSTFTVYCNDQLPGYNTCNSGVPESELLQFMGVRAVYFILWNDFMSSTNFFALEPTTQRYLKTIDADTKGETIRIIVVMYKDENSLSENDYQYAYLRFGGRG